MAVKLYLPGEEKTDIVSVTRPTFFVRTPEDFVELMEARRPDPETGQPDMERLGAFLGAHPESAAAIQAALQVQAAGQLRTAALLRDPRLQVDRARTAPSVSCATAGSRRPESRS